MRSGRKIEEMKEKRRMTVNAGFGAESRHRKRRDPEGDCGHQRATDEPVSCFDGKMFLGSSTLNSTRILALE
jgi:hypothetical protein